MPVNLQVKLTCVRSASIVVNHLIDIFIQTMNCSALEDHLLVSMNMQDVYCL